MLHNTTQLYGKTLGALDGLIGHVKDVYFDDQTWHVRYLVADTGTWLAERLVLISPQAFLTPPLGRLHGLPGVLRVNLTRQQIENSPAIDTHRPVSRQYEEEYHRYYGWPSYWAAGGTWGVAGYPVLPPTATPSHDSREANHQSGDPHLRSTKAIAGYSIHAIDGRFGHVRAFTVDDVTWTIRDLIVETGHWYAERKILVLPSDIERINYEESTVSVNLTKEDILHPERRTAAQSAVEALR